MDVLLLIPILLFGDVLPWAVLIGYPVLALTTKTFEKVGLALWLAGLICAAAWVYIGVQSMDYADANGTAGNFTDGLGWGITSLVLVAGSIIRAFYLRHNKAKRA